MSRLSADWHERIGQLQQFVTEQYTRMAIPETIDLFIFCRDALGSEGEQLDGYDRNVIKSRVRELHGIRN